MSNEGTARGLSIWLSAFRDNEINKKLAGIIGSSFEPHITLVTLPKATEDDIEEVIDSVKVLAKAQSPFNVTFEGVQEGSTYFKSIFLQVAFDEVLKTLGQKALKSVEKFADNYQLNPHLSLFYGPHNKESVDSITAALKQNNLEKTSYPIYSLDLWLTEGPADSWVHIGSAPLGNDLFYRSALLINNHWVAPKRKNYLPVINPANKTVFHFYPAGTKEDIDLAVDAAAAAFSSWSSTDGKTRAQYINAIADELKRRKDDIVRIEIMDNGKPLQEAKNDVDDTIACFQYYANQAIELDKKQDQIVPLADSRFKIAVRYEAVGVVGLIIPWNYPLLMAAWKVAPLLAAGATGVLKPSELTPLSALELAAICKKVGLPNGVLNVVQGTGPETGEPLTKHPQVEKVAFTGSVATGTKVMGMSAEQLKRVSLELGGKSPFIVFDDVDVNQATEWIMYGILWNQGQNCSATSRVLIHENIYPKIIEKMNEEIKKIKIGSGFDPSNKLGPLISEGQYTKVLNYIKSGQQEGAKLVIGGIPQDPQLLQGYFVPPTVFADVQPNMKIWQEEIFGPVLCVRTFKDEEEALKLANDSAYGLASAVMSKDKDRCRRFVKGLRAGVVWVNCSQPTMVEGPWGGMKKSGIGRELGPWGLEQYLEVKQVTSYEEDGMGYEWYLKEKSTK